MNEDYKIKKIKAQAYGGGGMPLNAAKFIEYKHFDGLKQMLLPKNT